MSHFGKDNIECRTDNQSILPSLESYRFNTPIANIEDADLVILCGTNPKIESPIINHKIFKSYNAGAEVFNIGNDISLNYPTHYLGESLNELNNDLLKKHLKKAANPILIIGSGFLNQLSSNDTLKSLFSFASKNKIISDDKNNLNFLNLTLHVLVNFF